MFEYKLCVTTVTWSSLVSKLTIWRTMMLLMRHFQTIYNNGIYFVNLKTTQVLSMHFLSVITIQKIMQNDVLMNNKHTQQFYVVYLMWYLVEFCFIETESVY